MLARLRNHLRSIDARLPASLFIAAVLVLQTIASADWTIFGLIRNAPYLWPFMDYPMYGPANYEGDAIEQYRVFAAFDGDDEEVEVSWGDVGLNIFLARQMLIPALEQGDLETLEPFVVAYEGRHGRRPSMLRLELHPLILHREGLRPGEVAVLAEVAVPPAGGGGP